MRIYRVRVILLFGLAFILQQAIFGQAVGWRSEKEPYKRQGPKLTKPVKKGSVVIRGTWPSASLEIIAEIAKIFHKADSLDVNQDDYATVGRFCDQDHPFDIMICDTPPTNNEKFYMRRRFEAGTPQPQLFLVGQSRIVLFVNNANSVAEIDFDKIRAAFSQAGKTMKWENDGIKGAFVKAYGPPHTAWSSLFVQKECMTGWEDSAEQKGVRYFKTSAFREDMTLSDDAAKIFQMVRSNTGAIGYWPYQVELEKLFEGVKVLAVGRTSNDMYVRPELKSVFQEQYPLAKSLVLYLHPKAPPLAKEFCEFAVGPEGAKIAAKYGLITPYAEKQYLAEKYVKMMKAGEGSAVGMTGPVNLRMLANGLILESVKANGPVQLKFADANESTAINSFLNRDDVYMLLLDSQPSERTMKLVATSWKKVQPVEHVIGGEAMAVIVNPANTATSLTPDQIRGLFSRQIKDWRFVAAKTAEGNGTARVECFGERLNTPAAQLFIDTVMPSSKIVGVKYRKTAGGVIASVAMDAGGVGFANAAMIDPADKAVRIVPIGLQEKSVLPTEETIMNGQYPFSRKLYLYVKPNAPEAVKTIVKFILSPQAADGFKANGYFPVPQPKPAPQTQPGKRCKKPTTQPAKPATTQPTTKLVTPTVPATQSAKKAA